MKITVVGGGNVGTQIAVNCAAKGHPVTMYSSRPDEFRKELEIVDENDYCILKGSLHKATYDDEEAFSGAELIFVTLPAFCMKEIGERIEQYVSEGAIVCIVPGTGGGECCFRGCIQKGAVLAGLQRVPAIARLVKYGEKVRVTGYKTELKLGTLPAAEAGRCAMIIAGIFDIPCLALNNYLNVTLTPSNPILHTTRLYTLFREDTPDKIYSRIPLFYQEWSMESAEELLACDDELQFVCKKMKEFDLSEVKSLREHYESPTAERMTAKIQSIKAFQGLLTPMVAQNEGFRPDYQSRYFTADFSYGLAILVNVAELCGAEVPHMKKVLEWYYKVSGDQHRFSYADYGIDTYEQFVRFYKFYR